ncbi:ComF family protein [Candidatus Daviesbacteria bacterium]|nr:ComF family protein [Candidatus Daviesbacteria bacterium]
MNLLDLLYPKRCAGCNKLGSYLCPKCILEIKQSDLICPFCERLSIGGAVHPKCKRKFGLDGLWFLGVYQNPLKQIIQKLKYRWVREVAKDLSDITIEYWAKHQPFLLDQIRKDQGQNWLVVPIPLHWARENFRGFNQAALLAELLAANLGLSYLNCLKRVKRTKTQVGLEAYERRKNIKGAFSLSKNCNLRSKKIILVDDVWTTGSTLKEGGYYLKRAGADKVWALTLAR